MEILAWMPTVCNVRVKHCEDGNGAIANHHSDCTRTTITECNKLKADVLITEDQRVMVREIIVQLNIG
jgi:hypothetical protein